MVAVPFPRLTFLSLALVLFFAGINACRAEPPATEPLASGPTPDTLTDEQVVKSIKHGIDFILADYDKRLEVIKKIPPSDRGDPDKIPEAGDFLLETYALLHVGPDFKDERLYIQSDRMKIAASVLLRFDSDYNYAVALQTLALAQMPQTAEVKAEINRTAQHLIEGRGKTGGYTYQLSKENTMHDQSNSQYALLAVWAAADWGVKVPGSYWKGVDEFWRTFQVPSGGWGYTGNTSVPAKDEPPTITMTAAGVASLYVCDEFLNRTPTLTPRNDRALDRGMAEFLDKFDPDSKDLYYLFGVERIGLASGFKFLNKIDWYRRIAGNLLKRQQEDGSFDAKFFGSNPTRSTCYAVLLLARGRAPVLMNKLQYNGGWNIRPRDSANVHAEIGRSLERHLNWQVVPIDVSYEQWLDAPILYISGLKDPNFSPEEVAKLRQFVRAGGMIFSSPDGDADEFNAAIKKYALEVLGEPGAPAPLSAFRELPPDHPLFTVAGLTKNPPKLMAVSNGLRELWIHSPVDYGAIWQSRDLSKKDAWDLPIMLYSYVAGSEELRSKLQTLSVLPPDYIPARKASVARIIYKGNWNAEPAAWPRLARLMAQSGAADVTVSDIKIADLGSTPHPPALAILAGTGKITLTDEERKSLYSYVHNGGTLLVEALAGDDAFAKSSHELMKWIFPDSLVKLVPPDYALYKGSFSRAAVPIPEVKYRRFWTLDHGQQTEPRLEFQTVNNRIGVFLSSEDITSGLLGTNTWGIAGYSPDSALAIAQNLILYAAHNAAIKPKPTPHK